MAGGELRFGTVSMYMQYMVVNEHRFTRKTCAIYMGTF